MSNHNCILQKKIRVKSKRIDPFKLRDRPGYSFPAIREKSHASTSQVETRQSAGLTAAKSAQTVSDRALTDNHIALVVNALPDDEETTEENTMEGIVETMEDIMPQESAANSTRGMEIIDVSAVDIYLNLLVSEDGILVEETNGLVCYLRDHQDLKFLYKDKYVIVCRKSVFVNNKTAWITWCCSCQKQSIVMMETLGNYLNCNAESEPTCLHRLVAETAWTTFDIINNIVPLPHTQLYNEHDYMNCKEDSDTNIQTASVTICNKRIGQTSVGICFAPYNAGVVFVKHNKLVCSSCKKLVCCHCQHISLYATDYPEIAAMLSSVESGQTSDFEIDHEEKEKTCKSTEKIPFRSCDIVASGLRFLDTLSSYSVLSAALQSACHCSCCDNIMEERVEQADAVIITNTKIVNTKVCSLVCPNCGLVVLFDGLSCGLLNMGRYLVGHDVLRMYMHSFLGGKRPLHSYYQVLCKMHIDYGNTSIGKVLCYDRLRVAWLSFLRLLDVDVSTGFSCPECSGSDGKTPEIIICDGTSISFQRRMWQSNLNTVLRGKVPHVTQLRFEERIYIKHAPTRKLLKRFATMATWKNKNAKPLTPVEKDELFNLLQKMYPALYQFIKSISVAHSCVAPSFAGMFLRSVASKSPVCVYIPVTLHTKQLLLDIVQGVNVKQDATKWHKLQELLPVVYDILMHEPSTTVQHEFSILVSDLMTISELTFNNCKAIEEQNDSMECQTDQRIAFFPALPQVRSRSLFAADKQLLKGEKACAKSFRGHPTLLPGLFAIYCQHNICYGFQVMITNESPNIPFTILRTRFQTAPAMVIYDNACTLHQYCLNRDPAFFSNTQFLVDRLHWDNHTGCSEGYNLNLYPHLSQINTQIAEQSNAGLKRIKDQLSYMTAANFMSHVSLFLYNKNIERILKLNAELA